MGRISRQRLRLPPSLHLHHRHPTLPSALPRSATAIANAAQYPKQVSEITGAGPSAAAPLGVLPPSPHTSAPISNASRLMSMSTLLPTSLPTSRPHPRPLHALLLVRLFYLDTSLVPTSRCPVQCHESRYLSGRRLRLRSATHPCCSRRRSPRPVRILRGYRLLRTTPPSPCQ
ncbi:hypothetical protein C8J57DRAFT_1373805 [Mycena rebaudengoi]|nr:hypothetical protein C8J57DRAFT_1373805 [Mycena rebaudengoi]